MKIITVLMSIFLFLPIAHGQFEELNSPAPGVGDGQPTGGVVDNTTDGSSNDPAFLGEVGNTETGLQSINSGVASGLLKGSRKAQDQGQTGAVLSAGFFAACSPFSGWFCAAGALAAVGSYTAFKQARTLNRQAANLLADSNPAAKATLDNELGNIDNSISTTSAQLSELENQGFVSDPNGNVTGPDGTLYTADSFKDGKSLQAAGVPAAKTGDVLAKIKKLQANAETAGENKAPTGGESTGEKSQTTAGIGGFGGAKSAGSGGEVSDGAGENNAVPIRLTASEANRYNTNFLGTRIGISDGDMFGIVTKKYHKGDKANTYFKREY